MIVPLRSSRATAMVRASRMLWAEGIVVARSECRFGCIALAVRASEPLGLGSGEVVPAWDQRTRTQTVRGHSNMSRMESMGARIATPLSTATVTGVRRGALNLWPARNASDETGLTGPTWIERLSPP